MTFLIFVDDIIQITLGIPAILFILNLNFSQRFVGLGCASLRQQCVLFFPSDTVQLRLMFARTRGLVASWPRAYPFDVKL